MSGAKRLPPWWRHLLLVGLTAGLLAAGAGLGAPAGWLPICAASAVALLLAARSPPSARAAGRPEAAAALCAALAAVGALAGLGVGSARIASLAAGAFEGESGERVLVAGNVAGQPRSSLGELRFPLATAAGRLLVSSRSKAELGIGDAVEVRGRLASPRPFRAPELERAGAALELRARRIVIVEGARGGVAGALDRARTRAERALTAGLDPGRSALARGFVLGQDDRIPPLVRERFRRSGLAHLLAVSGQNVMLLAILGGVLFSLAGVGPRARLILVLALIVVYVPVAGGAASIQRAGVMGAAGIIAGLLGRPADRLYVLLVAAAATLALNPHSITDIGWQLSFAAVAGIALWAGPLRGLIERRLPLRGGAGERLRRPLAEGAALTIAATAWTAPLMAHHFESLSLASLPANLLALPAVAPVMWLGMAAAMLGQVPLVPTAPIALVEGPLLDYIGAVAELMGRPDWALVRLPGGSPLAPAVAYVALLCGSFAAIPALGRRSSLRAPAAAGAVVTLGLALVAAGAPADTGRTSPDARTLRITQLDVGQGDSILLEYGARAALVDTGPPGGGVGEALVERDLRALEAVFISHDQLDHTGGLRELAGRVRIKRLLVASPAPELTAIARDAGAEVQLIDDGWSAELGRVAITALWPPEAGAGTGDANAASLVLAVEHEGWRALLTGDAEQEATGLEPGPIDVLKVAHHGSADAGLGLLLARSAPRLALIGVGRGNPHGHPAPETIRELDERLVCTLRTDRDGDLWVELSPEAMRVGSDRAGHLGRPGCERRL